MTDPRSRQRELNIREKQFKPLPEPKVKDCPDCGGSGEHEACKGKGCMDCDYIGSCDTCYGSGLVIDAGGQR